MPRIGNAMECGMRTDSRVIVSRFTGKRVHFIGIGGCGMSGLARILQDAGAIITGTDVKSSPSTFELSERGAKISYHQDGGMINPKTDLVVRTAAIPDDNPEFVRAVEDHVPTLKYAQLLGEVMRERFGIAVSGTHGKTTTTSMTAWALLQNQMDPSFVIGGVVKQLGGSSRSGAGEAFVVEACEFDRSFHNYFPKVAIITNIERDHLDCYKKGIDEIIESFSVFAKRTDKEGLIVANGQDKNVRKALEGIETEVQWIGFDDPKLDWSVTSTGLENGCHTGKVYRKGVLVAHLKLTVPGNHNLFNALAAIAVCAIIGVDPQKSADALTRFSGADRRMELLGEVNGAKIVDDYGHHPTEIQTTLRALREKYSPARLICVFQPHQFSRTRTLLDDFGNCFSDADEVLIPDIYAARDSEADKKSVSVSDMVNLINRSRPKAIYMPTLGQIIAHLREKAQPGELIAVMGAGNVCEVGHALAGSSTKSSKNVA